MIRLEYFAEQDFQQLIEWVPNAKFCLQWGGDTFSYPLTKEQLREYLLHANHADASDFIYKVIEDSSGNVIGHIALGNIDKKNNSARIRKVLLRATETRGKGYGYAMITTVLKIAFEELLLHKVTLGVFAYNESAIRSYKKAGFKEEGLIRDARKYENEYWDLVEMGMLEQEWMEVQGRN
ncbi:GNAT family N-acetyltransferase [Paenibacillus yanchengensis]|uniref:GNAT family N-acetyltransferase n=1 Tax=Paenibacillus yanchengensis TaxID=2035833 RepID=A0ABW4YF18_9BACL